MRIFLDSCPQCDSTFLRIFIDGCAIAITWEKGGFALWSVFGSLLTCSWSWTGDLSPFCQKIICSVDWAAEGYQLWMAVEPCSSQAVAAPEPASGGTKKRSTSLSEITISSGLFGIISFVKSALTVNPAMSQIEHLYLQGEDRLLISFSGDSMTAGGGRGTSGSAKPSTKNKTAELLAPLGNNKNWVVVPVPNTYLASNWPIHVSSLLNQFYYSLLKISYIFHLRIHFNTSFKL